jgi:hypothetical protein
MGVGPTIPNSSREWVCCVEAIELSYSNAIIYWGSWAPPPQSYWGLCALPPQSYLGLWAPTPESYLGLWGPSPCELFWIVGTPPPPLLELFLGFGLTPPHAAIWGVRALRPWSHALGATNASGMLFSLETPRKKASQRKVPPPTTPSKSI